MWRTQGIEPFNSIGTLPVSLPRYATCVTENVILVSHIMDLSDLHQGLKTGVYWNERVGFLEERVEIFNLMSPNCVSLLLARMHQIRGSQSFPVYSSQPKQRDRDWHLQLLLLFSLRAFSVSQQTVRACVSGLKFSDGTGSHGCRCPLVRQ